MNKCNQNEQCRLLLSYLILIIMTLDYRYIMKAGTIGILATFLISQVRELIQAINDLKQVKKSEVKSIQDISEDILKRKKSRLTILKLKPYYFQTKTKIKEIHSIQRYKFEPSDTKIVAQLQKQLSSNANQSHNQNHLLAKWHSQKEPTQWYASIDAPHQINGKNYLKIQGFGKIKGDFFNVQRKYIPEEKIGYWSRFRNWIYQRLFKSSSLIEEYKGYKYLVGPIIGILEYEINLMKDTKIIAVCNLENGKIIPTVTATSKSQIFKYYEDLIHQKYIIAGGLIVGIIIFGRWLLSDIKKELNAMKVRRNKTKLQYFNSELVADDKMCIICYNHVRNMIFFDCRHMIMCQECSETYDSDICPYCKMEIDDIKPVIGIP